MELKTLLTPNNLRRLQSSKRPFPLSLSLKTGNIEESETGERRERDRERQVVECDGSGCVF